MSLYRNWIFTVFIFASLQLARSQNLNLRIEGSSKVETSTIDSIGYKKTFINYSALEHGLDSTLNNLDRYGYFNNELLYLNKINDSSYLARLKLNKAYSKIIIFFDHLEQRELIREKLGIKNKDFFETSPWELEQILLSLVKQLARQGDPFYELKLTEFNTIDQNILSAKLEAKTNKKRVVDKIIIKGYEKFPVSFSKYLINIKKDQPLDIEKIVSKTKKINQLKFARQTREPEILFTNDSSLLYIYVEKVKRNNFDGFLGFGTNEETNKLQLDGFLNLNLINNLNYGEKLSIYYKSDESDQKTFDLKVSMPYLFKLPIGVKAQLNIFKKDSTFLTTTQKGALDYYINPSSSLSLGYTQISSDDLLGTSVFDIDNFDSQFIEAEYSQNIQNIDDLLYPIDFLLNVKLGIGNRKSELDKVNQNKIELETFKLFQLNNRNSLFGKVTSAYLISDNYFENELYRFGGINSIRGFKENTITANLFAVLNTEYRYRLSSNFYVHSVLDASYFENEISDVREKLFGFGFGFGLLTDAGLLKFNYSGSKVGNNSVRVSDFKIHISLSANF